VRMGGEERRVRGWLGFCCRPWHASQLGLGWSLVRLTRESRGIGRVSEREGSVATLRKRRSRRWRGTFRWKEEMMVREFVVSVGCEPERDFL
jgi:hypothetical protein